jgi:ketosteroid isomerase-like protein
MPTSREDIAAANKRFGDLVSKRDFAGLAACYTDDAQLLPPGSQVVTGRPAIGPFWEAAVAALGVQAATLTTHELEVHGDTANEVGEGVLKTASGEAKVKYLVIWKREADGIWKMHRDIWNDLPK